MEIIMINEKFNLYINRELSWIRFNERVLEEAECATNPIYERLKFCSIYSNNLDEFYMVRVGSLLDQTFLKKVIRDSKTNMTPAEQISAVNHAVHDLLKRKDNAYFQNMQALSQYGLTYATISTLTKDELSYVENYFMSNIIHLLSPQIIDKHHPFPFLENKKLYIGLRLHFKNEEKFGIIPIESYLEHVIYLSINGTTKFILIEELIYHFANKLFPNKNILDKTIFRTTRNTDIDISDDLSDQEVDYIEIMQELLKKRRKLAAVRLEFQFGVSPKLCDYLCSNLHLTSEQIFIQDSPLDLSFIFGLESKLSQNPALFYKTLRPQHSPLINKLEPLAKQIQRKDILMHYPYNSMKDFIRLLDEAATDKEVISIKMTLYRMAKGSEVISALIKAAENGIDVSVVVELRARFDERNNIEWSKQLEDAGCKVIYGLEGYKVHSKLLLITRKSGNKINYITHIGTGNFNEKTAKLYTDISLFTANQDIGIEASAIFNCLFTGEFVEHTNHLLVAPKCLKNHIIELIDREIAFAAQNLPSEIILKMNSLTDKLIINKLIEASQAGVKITMIIRGICCLRPGIAGVTDNIKVISIVGRFLEHSRIYVFGSRERADVFISSADFMTRNTEKRVEVATPIYDESNKAQIFEWLDIICHDNVKARVLQSDGSYTHQLGSSAYIDSQDYLYEKAYESAKAATLALTSKAFNKSFKYNLASFIQQHAHYFSFKKIIPNSTHHNIT